MFIKSIRTQEGLVESKAREEGISRDRELLFKTMWQIAFLTIVTLTPSLFSMPESNNDNNNADGGACHDMTAFILAGGIPELSTSLKISESAIAPSSSAAVPFAASFDSFSSSSSSSSSSYSPSSSSSSSPLCAVTELLKAFTLTQSDHNSRSVQDASFSVTSVLALITNLAIAQHSAECVAFVSRYLMTLAPLLALSLDSEHTIKNSIIGAIAANITELSVVSSSSSSLPSSPLPCPQSILGEVLVSYQQASISLTAACGGSNNTTGTDKIFAVCSTALDCLLSTSRTIDIAREDESETSSSSSSSMTIQLCALILQQNVAPIFARALLTSSLRLMQTQAASSNVVKNTNYSKILLQVLFTPTLYVLSDSSSVAAGSSSDADKERENFELISVQLILFSFNLLEESRRAAMIELILPVLCQVLMRYAGRFDSPTILFCGKGLTALARTFPEVFRVQISTLSEAARTTLMEVMKSVQLQQQQQQQQQQQGATGGQSQPSSLATGPKKIDFSKFKS